MSYELTTTGPSLLPADTTDAQIVYMWVYKGERSPHTQRLYQSVASQFLAHVGRPIQAVTYADLDDWAKSLAGKPATRRTKIDVVKSLFSFATRMGYLRLDPASVLASPKLPDRKHRKTLTEEQVIHLIGAARNKRDAAILRTLYSSGCRISELCTLTWADVVETQNGKAELHLWGKGSKSRRAGISAATYTALLAIRGDAGDGDYVFRSNRGNPMDPSVVQRQIKRLAQRVGIEAAVSPHWFRHSHATHALRRGANPVDLQEQLGHSSLSITTGYAHRERSSADVLAI